MKTRARKLRNCVYETYCWTCHERQDAEIERKYKEVGPNMIQEHKRLAKRFIYIGETNRSVYERGIEHQNDVPVCKTSSHMLRHLWAVHEEHQIRRKGKKRSQKEQRQHQTHQHPLRKEK